MIYNATSSLPYFYLRYGELSATVSDVRWWSRNNIYYLGTTAALNVWMDKYYLHKTQ